MLFRSAEAKSVLIRLRKDSEEKMELAASYENKAVLLLKKAESGGLVMEEADRLATAALAKKEEVLESSSSISKSLNRQEELTGKLDMRVQELKANIGKWENELVTLKARSKVAEASSKLNKQLAQVDSSGTLALLEKMKNKVAEEEALAESYGEMIDGKSSVDDEIDKAIKGSSVSPSAIKGADSLAALKSRLNIR